MHLVRVDGKESVTPVEQAAAFIAQNRGYHKAANRWQPASIQRFIRARWPDVTLLAAYRAVGPAGAPRPGRG